MKIFRLVILFCQFRQLTIWISFTSKTFCVDVRQIDVFCFRASDWTHVTTNRSVKYTLACFFSFLLSFSIYLLMIWMQNGYHIKEAYVTCGWFIGILYASLEFCHLQFLVWKKSRSIFIAFALYQQGQTNNCECNNLRPFRILCAMYESAYFWIEHEFNDIHINSSVNKI